MFTNIWNTVKSWWAKPQPVAQHAQPTIPLPVSVIGDKPVVEQPPEKTQPAPVETPPSPIVTPIDVPVVVVVPVEPAKAPVVETAVVAVQPAPAPVVETAVVASEPVVTKPVKQKAAKASSKPAKNTKEPRQEPPAVVKKSRRGKSTAT